MPSCRLPRRLGALSSIFAVLFVASFAAAAGSAEASTSTVYAVDSGSDSLTPINPDTGEASPEVSLGDGEVPLSPTLSPDDKTLYFLNEGKGLARLDLSTRTLGSELPVGATPNGLALSPDGQTAYVTNNSSPAAKITKLDLTTETEISSINTYPAPKGLTLTPNGTMLLLISTTSHALGEVLASTSIPQSFLPLPTVDGTTAEPDAIAIAPNGTTGYVTDAATGLVYPMKNIGSTPFSVETAIAVGTEPGAVAITPDGKTAYVANRGSDSVTPINVETQTAGAEIPVGSEPSAVAVAPDGKTVYVADKGSDSVTPIDTETDTAEEEIPVGSEPSALIVAGPPVDTTIPDAPTAVSAVAGDEEATVNWTAPGEDGGSPILEYVVTPIEDGVPGTPIHTGDVDTSLAVPGLADGASYTFTVAAVNAGGEGPPSEASAAIRLATAPDAPTAVSAVAGDEEATVSWAAPADGGAPIGEYVVTPRREGVAQAPIPTGSAGTSFAVHGLENGVTYTFTVAAVNVRGEGPASAASAPITLATLPGAPTGVTATGGDKEAKVSWTAPADDGHSPILEYVVIPIEDGVAGAPIHTFSAATQFEVEGLTDGSSYAFSVAAVNVRGEGPASAPSATVQVAAPTQSAPSKGNDSPAPSAPVATPKRNQAKPPKPSLSQVKLTGKGALTLRLSTAAKLTVKVERKAGRRWTKVETVSRQGRAGADSIPLKLKKPGSYRVMVSATGPGGASAGVTRTATIKGA